MPQNLNILKLHLEKNGIRINKEVANTPSLIIVNSRSLLFPELNQLLLEGILLSPTCPKNDAKLINNF